MNKRKIIVKDDHCDVLLTRGKISIIDTWNYEKINKHSWCAFPKYYKYYAVTGINYKNIFMHNFLFEKKGYVIKFKSFNTLDCREKNILYLTHTQYLSRKKLRKSNYYDDIYYNQSYKKWEVIIIIGNYQHNLGLFDTEDEAYNFLLNKRIKL